MNLLCPVMLANLKDWEGNHIVSFFSLTVALAVLTMRDLFCTVDPESYLETSRTSVNVTAMQVEKKKRKDTHVRNKLKQRLVTNRVFKAMLSQMYQWITKLSLCEAFIGVQCRHQHFCLIFTTIMSALP